MNVLIAYDVSTVTPAGKSRLRRVAKACEAYGQRVQYSLFEVICSRTDLAKLMGELTDLIEPAEDSLRVYKLDRDGFDGVIALGRITDFAADEPWTL